MKRIQLFLLFIFAISCETENDSINDCSLTESEMSVVRELRQTSKHSRPISVMKQKIDSLYDSMLKSAIDLDDEIMKTKITESRVAFYQLLDLNASVYYRSFGEATGKSEFKKGYESDFLQKYYRELIFLEDHLRESAEGYLEVKDIK